MLSAKRRPGCAPAGRATLPHFARWAILPTAPRTDAPGYRR